MSQTMIFGVGIVIFALTVAGAITAGARWFGHIAESDDERLGPRPSFTEYGPIEVDGTPATTIR